MFSFNTRFFAVACALGVSLALWGCKEESKPAAAPVKAEAVKAEPVKEAAAPAAGDVKKEAETIFATRCTPCHGPTGHGDGAASAGLTPKPANFSDPAWQASVTDEHIEQIIAYGGGAVGKSPAMPPNPDLADKPVVKGLREFIRGLKQN